MNNLIKRLKKTAGVSLIELVVAVAIFSVLIMSATGIFKMVIDGQRNAISAQNVQENMRYAMEKISKEIRMAQKSDTECLGAATRKVFNTAGGDRELYFKNQYGQCVNYYLQNGRLKIILGQGSSAVEDFVTPSKIEISNLKFYIVDDLIGTFHSTQPYVTIAMDVKAVGLALHEQKMKIQMTVSSRFYE